MKIIGVRPLGLGCILLAVMSASARAQTPAEPGTAPAAGGTSQEVVIGGPVDGDLLVRTRSLELVHRFQIEWRTQTTLDAVTFHVSPLIGKDGTVVNPTWTVEKVEGLPLARRLEVKATLPVPGVYTAEISVLDGQKPHRRTFRVQVPSTSAPVEIAQIPAGRAILSAVEPWDLWDLWPPERIRLRIDLKSTADQAVTIPELVLESFALQGANNARYQPGIERAVFRSMDGTELKTGIELQPGAGETIELTLEDVRDPGYYTGSVRVALGDGQTISQTVELYAKESWWLLALWLGCGVLASSGLRYWFKTHRPSLIRRELLLRLSEQVDALPVDASMKGAREIQEALQRSIDDALTRLQAEWTEVDAEWKQNVDRWLKTLPACIALLEEWLLAQQPGSPPSSPAIEEARRVLRRAAIIASVLSLDDIDRAHKALIDAQRAESSQPVQERLDRQLEALAGMADAPGGVYDTARKRLTAARDALQDPARQAEAPRLLAEAEQAWTRVRVADLEAALAGKAIHTDRTSQWEQLRDDAAALDRALAEKNPPGDAAARLGTLLRAFLREVVTQIDEELKIQESTAEDAAPDKRSKIREAIAKVKDCRSAIAGQLERDDLERTDASYKELVAAYGALMALSSATMADRGAGLPAMTMALAEPKEPVQPPRGKARRRTVQSSEAVRRERQWKEAVVFVLGIGIALVAGTQALWLDNPTWGGPSSWIAAILWGLGLHQLTGLGLDGLEKPKEAGK